MVVAVPAATFADEQVCVSCHSEQHRNWQGSHHQLAMQDATQDAVLGDFTDASFDGDAAITHFTQRDGEFVITTDGPDGRLADFPVRYTFGVEPLQQYLLELPGGRLQAFTIAWDTQRKRWFDLYPDERIDHRDELHWTRPSQNWNYMCAECHSTQVEKGYRADAGVYQTTFKQINVGCQACHGPASEHLAWTRDRRQSLAGTEAGTALPASSGFGMSLKHGTATAQVETCARCHARRAGLWGEYRHGRPFMDTHLPSTLDPGLYLGDGQIDAEVFEYGSFLQSKMHQKGLRCSDCHDAHSLTTRGEGNALCASCHNATAAAARSGIDTSGLIRKNYDDSSHHFHAAGSPGSSCVACHAPARNYMVVDPRHDHSFRIPRPDLSVRLGTPNACNACHADRDAPWAAATVKKWYGEGRRQEWTFGEALAMGQRRDAGAAAGLLRLAHDRAQPAIARASAMTQLRAYPSRESLSALLDGLSDRDPLVRQSALGGMELLPVEQRLPAVKALLVDPVRLVRMEAARLLAGAPQASLDATTSTQLRAALAEYEAAQRSNADRPESHLNLGNLYISQGQVERADTEFRAAMSMDAAFVPAYTNLADLKRSVESEAAAEQILRDGVRAVPGSAILRHALALTLIRTGRRDEALSELSRASSLAPENPRMAYVYGIALHDLGRPAEGTLVLERALQRHPGNHDLMVALAAYARQGGNERRARAYLDTLQAIESPGPGTSP